MDWRTWLYPFGLLASLAFMSRVIVQWISSEQRQKSVVTRLFWRLSLAGNVLLALHAFIQVQFPICLVQTCHAVLAVRNLNLLRPQMLHWRLKTVIITLGAACGLMFVAFTLQSYVVFDRQLIWSSVPSTPWQHPVEVSPLLHLFGTVGVILFASRFWAQWWYAEKQHASVLNPTFWWLSLSGALLSTIYFALLGDVVNVVGPAVGLVPYVRNLILINRIQRTAHGPSAD